MAWTTSSGACRRRRRSRLGANSGASSRSRWPDTTDVERLLSGTPGFGRCYTGRCPYRDVGSPSICFSCARRTMDTLSGLGEPCPTCEHPMDDGRCGNPVCGRDARWFAVNSSVAARTGILKARINDYKYGGQTGWAAIFGRVLAGYLEANATRFRRFGLIVASPVFVGPEGRATDHIRAILLAAEAAAPGEWPFDLEEPPAIVRTRATDRFTGMSYQERRAARVDLRGALMVPRRERTTGLRIAVVDDVFTTGTTLDEVARALRSRGGAREVVGISLARQVRGR